MKKIIVILVLVVILGGIYISLNKEKNQPQRLEEDDNLKMFLSNIAYFNVFNQEGEYIQENYTKLDFNQGVKLQIASLYVYEKIFNEDAEEANKLQFKKDDINLAIKEIFNENVTNSISSEFALLKYDESINKYVYKEAGDAQYSTYIVEIEKQEYANGVYKITFLYAYPTEGDLLDNNIDNYDCYRMSVNVKLNENYTYSKYRIEKLESAVSKKVGKIRDFK